MSPVSELIFILVVVVMTLRIIHHVPESSVYPRRLKKQAAGLAIIASLGWSLYASPPEDFESGLAIIVRAMLIGGVVLVGTGFILPLVTRALLIVASMSTVPVSVGQAFREHRRRKAAAIRAAEAAERAAVDAANRARDDEQAAQRHAADQLRRENARSGCVLLYNLFAPEIGSRFSRTEFDAFVQQYLGDDREPAYVEERASQLSRLIEQHVHKVEPLRRFNGIEQLATWFEDQVRQIEKISDERMRRTGLALLKSRYADMTKQFLEEMQF